MTRRILLGAGVLLAAGAAVYLLIRPSQPAVITGTVVDEAGHPIAGAVVRIQATATMTRSAGDGSFALPSPGGHAVTAWAPGYYIGGGDEPSARQQVEIVLSTHPDTDHPGYEWLTVDAEGDGENKGCAACHSSAGTDVDHPLPVDEWAQDAHGLAMQNRRFLTMYLGTDIAGNRSPETRYVTAQDYGRIPLRPDPEHPYYGPGYKLDFPTTAGNCASCHAPAAAADDAYGIDPSALTGVAAEGISCDFCHKVWDVRIDAETGLPAPGMPGVLSTELRRPPADHQFFAGPFDDVAPGEDVFSPLQLESRFCAACHSGSFWDTVVYDSYGEWLRSPYSDPVTGQTCQECHMPSTGATVFALPDEGGNERDPATIRSHLMPGASDVNLLRNTVTMNVDASLQSGLIAVEVSIANTGAGHHVPTDSPLRHLILVVAARDPAGRSLDLIDGPELPEWAGVGDPEEGYYAGMPGAAYAKVLEELWTGVSPTGAYWQPTRVVSDNRIPAFGSDTTSYSFAAPAAGPTVVDVKLVFRRAYIDLMAQKGWTAPDIVMAAAHVQVD